MTRPMQQCHECHGEGKYEVLNGYQSRTAIEPATHEETCEVCGGTGEYEYDWCAVTDDLPKVGEKVMVIGFDDGAPDRVLIATEDVLVDEGEWDDPTQPPKWEKCIEVREWASL